MPDTQTDVPPPIQPPPPIAPPASSGLPEPEKHARLWNMLCHLSALTGYIGVPFGNIWMPLLIWQIKKHDVPSVEIHGKAAFNFQLTVVLAIFASGILAVIGAFFCLGHILMLLPLAILVTGCVYAVINGIKANDGEPIHYPYAIEFF